MSLTVTITDEQLSRFTAARDKLFTGRKLTPNLSDTDGYITRYVNDQIEDLIKWLENPTFRDE